MSLGTLHTLHVRRPGLIDRGVEIDATITEMLSADSALYDMTAMCTEPAELAARYADLMAQKAVKEAAALKKASRKANRKSNRKMAEKVLSKVDGTAE
jgi:hypothetical protein